MAITNFIPEVWSAAILEALRAKLVFPSLCNRDYEGDIREAGDTVHITGYNDVTVHEYVRGKAITVDDATDKEAAVLKIDKSDYFAFKVNDLDKTQAKADLTGKFTNSAAYNMMKNVETYISNLMDTAVSTPAKTVAVGTPADAYLAVVEAGRKLDVQNVPDEGRWLVVSPDFYALLLQDSRFIEGTEAGHNTLLNGVVGQVRGFTVVKSNNVPRKSASPDTQSILAGTNAAVTFAQQVSKVEAMRMQTDFADMVRGLDLYGAKVIRPECLTKITLNLSTSTGRSMQDDPQAVVDETSDTAGDDADKADTGKKGK
ncbi:P22 phage major capsid protein family protein [Bifidobacterium pseudocatenulatum]|uniref:P22 phage major capsid protein family protein n=1 Tax=Bifidobacterium pseudocatenulatum TaxID=28026 RepID=A0ABD4W9W2_BIFPS|nr:P22 phage major capsid protein family protein [Bifidobacterium pseudocatenulatum]MDB6492431.1 P22 phage major capsid protein family protein [Bifidobacterium pseudocatenulatum]MDB6493598.1 P22 phage major capsid protein family protein [Bifidobacterium pseudocatenulatum]MDB6504775.1 P22 phage major capsid protein family protein [Bifidobacterium pseudocatenulatum]